MAVQVRRETEQPAEPVLVMRAVEPVVQPLCGDCRFHIPYATKPGGWCACEGAELRWQQVETGRAVCADFADWPEGSPVPAFLAAMRF